MRQLDDLVQIMDKLLGPDGCPWDREQTPQSLAPFAIEEAHELAEALDSKDALHIQEELGDLLFQVVIHSGLASRAKDFTLENVIEGICEKLIRRHPHVFGDVKVKDTHEVLQNWEKIKNQEKKKGDDASVEFNIPKGLPALQRAQKIGEKSKRLKFDWDTASEVLSKVREEFGEFEEAIGKGDKSKVAEELGDLFFALVQYARLSDLDAETVLRKGNSKIENRIKSMFKLASDKKLDFFTLTNEQKESLWAEIKRTEA